MKNRVFLFLALFFCVCICASAQEPFWLGADVSGAARMEKHGVKLFNVKGQERQELPLMKELGLNAVRLRVWVNPKDGWCDKEEVLSMARQAKALNMAIMLCFHYSDTWADPGKQFIPEAWKDYSYSQMKRALAGHTTEVCQLLKKNGIDVRWIQVGNETTHGFLWPMGRAEEQMKQYAGLTEAGCRAAKKVYPAATTIVHLDGGCDLTRYRKIFDALRQYKVDYDMIGMSVYPYWDLSARLTQSDDETLSKVVSNIKTLHQEYGKELMIVETGYEAVRANEGYQFLSRLITAAKNDTEGHCHGVFYWAPELEGHYELGAFYNHRPTRIMAAFSEAAAGTTPPAMLLTQPLYAVSQHDCESPNGRIWGRLYLPQTSQYKKGEQLPLVIMAHGFGATHEEVQRYAEVVASEGIAAYIFDFCGGGMKSRSEGKTTDMSIFTEQADLEAITRQLSHLGCIDPQRIMLLGCSQGGLVSSITAAAHPDDYSALVLVYPALGIPFTAREMLSKTAERPDEFEFWGMKISKKYYEPLVDYDPFQVIGQYKRPVMTVYGDKDDIVPPALVEMMKQKYSSDIRAPRPQAEFHPIKDGGHGFRNLYHHRQAERYVLQFIKRMLNDNDE